jgi:hypothetical protein
MSVAAPVWHRNKKTANFRFYMRKCGFSFSKNSKDILMSVSKNPNARPCRAFCGIYASENLSVLALRTPFIFFFELPQNSRQLQERK